MRQKFNPADNLRLDVPDARSVHDLADDGLRSAGAVVHSAGEPGLTISGLPFAPVAAVVHGFDVAENALNDQQVLVTPGVAFCEELVDGVLQQGQISTSGAQRPLTIGGALVTKYIWARFVYVDGVSANRAFWRPSAVPEVEEVALHNTRRVADFQLDYTDASSPPAANAGWFLTAEVDYSAGAIFAADIADRRVLLLEGQAAGTANPATTWTIPNFDRAADRSTVGSRSLFGWVMRIMRRVLELGGRSWYEGPAYGETVRSASGAILVSDQGFEAPHFAIDPFPLVADVEAALNTTMAPDNRAATRFVSSIGGAEPVFSVDTGASSAALGVAWRVLIDGNATFRRTAGANPLGATAGATGWKGSVSGLTFRASTIGSPILDFASSDDDVTFVGCTFDAPAKVTDLVAINSAGRYTFINCTFTGDNTPSTTLISISGTAEVLFSGCRFGTAALGAQRGIYIPAGTPKVRVEASVFDTLVDGVKSLVGPAVYSLTGCTFTGIVSNATDIAGFLAQPTFEGGAHHGGQVIGDTLRANSGFIYMQDALGYLSMTDGATALFTGADGAGGVPDLAFDNVWSNAGRYLFGNTSPALTGDRLEKVAAGGGAPERFAFLDVASPTGPTLPVHARRVILGDDATDTRAVLSAHIAPKAWGLCRYTNGTPDTQAGGGWRYDEVALTVTYTNFNPGAGAQHKWQVSGLNLASDEYAVVCTVSMEPTAEATIYYNGASDGYSMTAVVYNKTSNGFDIAPVLRDDAGRLSLADGALNTAVDSYDISFTIIAHGTVL